MDSAGIQKAFVGASSLQGCGWIRQIESSRIFGIRLLCLLAVSKGFLVAPPYSFWVNPRQSWNRLPGLSSEGIKP